MHEPLDFAEAASRARVIAVALAQGRSLDLWSLALVTLALAGLLWVPFPLLASISLLVSILVGVGQKVFALRVAFDAVLFHHWAEAWNSNGAEGRDPNALATDLMMFDQALADCGLGAPRDDVVHDLHSRLRGAARLLRRQALALAIQFVAMVIAMVLVLLSRLG
ncbi:MAG: hypothetical protein ACYCZQ_05625 [Burkholderiales bacterium]